MKWVYCVIVVCFTHLVLIVVHMLQPHIQKSKQAAVAFLNVVLLGLNETLHLFDQ